MLARLRLDRFIRRNHKKHQVYSRGASQHVANETLMPGHIYKTELHAIFFQKSKPKINGYPAALLFRQPVRMGARQRLHERRLAVVDMSRRSNNYAFRGTRHWIWCLLRWKDSQALSLREFALPLIESQERIRFQD